MSSKIEIVDFDLFFETMKAAAKLVKSAKLQLSPEGLEIYGACEMIARCEIVTTSVKSQDTFDFCIDDIGMLNRVLTTVKGVHKDSFDELSLSYSRPNLMFKSSKIKMKYSTCNESTISGWISKKIEAKMTSVFELKTTSDLIKQLNGHTFLFTDTGAIKIYIETKDDMEKNAVFATLGNMDIDLGKEITLKMGLVTFGKIPEDKRLVIDVKRLNLFNCIPSNDIVISLTDKNCLLSKQKMAGKNGSSLGINIYCSFMKG
jgi:hypothetical protein